MYERLYGYCNIICIVISRNDEGNGGMGEWGNMNFGWGVDWKASFGFARGKLVAFFPYGPSRII